MLRIAIHQDILSDGTATSHHYSGKWLDLARQFQVDARVVDIRSPDFFDAVRGCDGFLWRFSGGEAHIAKRVLLALEHAHGMRVFPRWPDCWWAQDKIAQHYLMSAAQIPTPRTWVFWNAGAARDFCSGARFPLVLKLATGSGGGNVCLVRTRNEAAYWINELFSVGVPYLDQRPVSWRLMIQRFARNVGRAALMKGFPVQRGYVYLQEYLPHNDGDTRVTIIGQRAYAFRRRNRPGDFRASGSGLIEYSPNVLSKDAIQLAFHVARKLKLDYVALDIMRRGHEWLVSEFNFAFASSVVDACPGFWVANSDTDSEAIRWVAARPMASAEAVFEVFLNTLRPELPSVFRLPSV